MKPIWILLKQETASGSGISWAIRKSAPRSRQITTPAPTTQFFTDRMPFLHPTNSVKALKAHANNNCGSPQSCDYDFWRWSVATPSELFDWQVRYLDICIALCVGSYPLQSSRCVSFARICDCRTFGVLQRSAHIAYFLRIHVNWHFRRQF